MVTALYPSHFSLIFDSRTVSLEASLSDVRLLEAGAGLKSIERPAPKIAASSGPEDQFRDQAPYIWIIVKLDSNFSNVSVEISWLLRPPWPLFKIKTFHDFTRLFGPVDILKFHQIPNNRGQAPTKFSALIARVLLYLLAADLYHTIKENSSIIQTSLS